MTCFLGWKIDGHSCTKQLSPQKEAKIQTLINSTFKKKAVPLKTFQKLQGKLIHTSIDMLKSRGLLALICKTSKHKLPNKMRP